MSDTDNLSGTVVVTYPGFDDADQRVGGVLREAGLTVRIEPKLGERTADDLVGLLGDAVAAVADADPFDATVFSRVPTLRLVARVGVGFDSVDLQAATRAGAAVTTTPGANHETVADHALALILAVVRKLSEYDAQMRQGEWPRGDLGGTLFGTTVGVIGFGRIGRATVRRLRGFGCRVLVHDPYLTEADEFPLVDIDELIQSSDVITVHAPLTPETRHYLSTPQFAAMKPGAIVVNTARGPLIDQAALIEALRSGHLGGAGLDVFEIEPVDPEQLRILSSLNRVVLSPHVAGLSGLSNLAMCAHAARSVIGVLTGTDTRFVINRDVIPHLPGA
jgi:D-3-phosphoglycerate dehydrogenase / 2-oxoglutarate reductase